MKTSIVLLFSLCFGTAIAIPDIAQILRTIRDPGKTHLWLHDFKLKYENVVSIAAALNGSKITSLALFSNNIGDREAVVLANVLQYTNINRLVLWGHNIGVKGASAIAKVLKDTRITHLELCWNNIDDGGARALATGLIGSRVNNLNLGDNQIRDEGAKAIADSLNQTAISSLDLGGCLIGYQGRQALAEALDGTVVTELYLDQVPKDLGTRIKDSLSRNKLKMKLLRQRYNNFVITRNGSLQFNTDGALTKKSDYIEFVRIIGNNKPMYRSVFIFASPKNHKAEQIADFIDNIESRLEDCLRISEVVVPGFKNFVGEKNGSLEFLIEYVYTNKSDYIEFAETIGRNKSFYREGSITEEDYGKKKIRDFVDNIEKRLADCFRISEILVEGFRNLVGIKNGSLEFVIDYVHSNKSDYIEFVETIWKYKPFYSVQLITQSTEIQVQDFMDNIVPRLSDCFQKSELVLKGFKDFVTTRNGSLEFVIDHANTNKFDYIEFARIIGRYKPFYNGQLIIRKSTTIQVEDLMESIESRHKRVQDFMDNVEKRLEDCFRKSEYVYQQFEALVIGGENGSLEFKVNKKNPRKYEYLEFTVLISKDKQSWINYLSSFGTEKNWSDQVRDFVENILQRLFVVIDLN